MYSEGHRHVRDAQQGLYYHCQVQWHSFKWAAQESSVLETNKSSEHGTKGTFRTYAVLSSSMRDTYNL